MSIPIGKIPRVVTRSIARVAVWHAEWQLRQFLKGLPHCERVQDRFLERILLANQDSDFGHQHGFARMRSYSDFTHAIPVAHYSYYAPYVERCKSGDTKALFGPSQRLLTFVMTSGTTGLPKYIPATSRFMAAYHRGWNIWIVKYLADHPEAYLRKLLQVSSPTETERTISGHPCGSISAALARHQKRIVRYFYATPREVAGITDAQARCYMTMRFALMGDIGTIVTANPSMLILLAQTAEGDAGALIRDIHDGRISESVELPSGLRSRLIARLRPNPRRSRQLERLLQEHGRLLPRHYWDPAALGHWMGGTAGLYLPQIRQYYGDKPIRDIGLLASEGRMSIPLEDNTPAGVLDIFANFYEFIPEDEISSLEPCNTSTTLPDNLTVLRAHELRKGGQYFILLTNHAGLCRYHVGDIVRVTDFVGSTPVIEFLSRGAHTSSVTGEKLTEHQVVTVVGDVLRETGDGVATFTMVPVWADPPYYRLHLESQQARESGVLEPLAERIDRMLGQVNPEYRSKRQSRRLGPLQVRQSVDGTGPGHAGTLTPGCRILHEQYKHRFLLNEPVREEPGPVRDECTDKVL